MHGPTLFITSRCSSSNTTSSGSGPGAASSGGGGSTLQQMRSPGFTPSEALAWRRGGEAAAEAEGRHAAAVSGLPAWQDAAGRVAWLGAA